MIAHLKGKLVEKSPTHLVIECQGVGYLVFISLNTYSKISDQESCMVYTQMVVREDAQLLYGFYSMAEKKLFQLLIAVSGVGPATAILVLSSADANEIEEAILSENVAWFKGVKGIGPKSAQRIILELKDKVNKDHLNADFSGNLNNTIRNESLSALVNLGFNKNQAEKLIQKILKDNSNYQVEDVIKYALKGL